MDSIIASGIGWIAAGIIALAVWIGILIHGIADYGMLSTAIFVIALGLIIILFRKRIGKLRESMLAKRSIRN